MEEELIGIKNTAITFILESESLEDLEETKLQFLGRSGKLTLALKEITKIPIERRKEVGILINEVKATLENAINDQKQILSKKKKDIYIDRIDVTNPGIAESLGHLHLVTQAIEEITDIFTKIGFERVRYPEIEWDWYSFGALNFPQDHPARDDWETFFIKAKPSNKYGPMLLTPHTSSGQIREMQRKTPPIRMLNIAKTYRRQSDISHVPMFHQFEGLVVDKDIAITHLKGTLDFFVKSFFGSKREFRIRPYHFQFTEPSFEVDVSCGVCFGKARLLDGSQCRVCKAGWLELGGAGMVHPNVLRAGGIDPKIYTGFAFGFGPERCMMMKEGLKIDDLRLLYSNNLEFLKQF